MKIFAKSTSINQSNSGRFAFLAKSYRAELQSGPSKANSPSTRRSARSHSGILLLLAFASLLISCSRESYNLGQSDYYKFHLEAGKAMCAKMQECYAPFLRTLRPEYQRQVNRETCLQALNKDLRAKIEIHTPEMQQLSRACYGQLLQRNCKEFLVGTVFIPACQELMEQTSAEFQKHPALIRKLLTESQYGDANGK
ncbi:MAG: hypothetical protein RH862_09850 [Leptospiraceae bacterium]